MSRVDLLRERLDAANRLVHATEAEFDAALRYRSRVEQELIAAEGADHISDREAEMIRQATDASIAAVRAELMRKTGDGS